MSRYFLHLRDGTDELLDPEGSFFDDLEQLRTAVLAGARDVMANELKSAGTVDLRYRIDAEDENGNIVFSLPFADAAHIVPAH